MNVKAQTMRTASFLSWLTWPLSSAGRILGVTVRHRLRRDQAANSGRDDPGTARSLPPCSARLRRFGAAVSRDDCDSGHRVSGRRFRSDQLIKLHRLKETKKDC